MVQLQGGKLYQFVPQSSSSVSVFIEASGLSHVASCHKGVCFRKSKFHSV